ncbi:exonuclease domain-containing protein [Corynebacterium sp. AOP40-9SA-29]|uniref:exonuclease domain-containing protein n=1 Tax=Corynebacterium sp. AOP40-9SA-29 TaxID=3457677 RepID=UPI0040344150
MTSQTQLSPFAVVDVETTGFSNRDRVLEVAVVHADADGTVTGRWSTLINPQRDIPNTRIHGISGADLIGAPSFADIAGDLAEQLSGRIFVAHNAPFDTRLLGAEFARLGITAVPFAEAYLCTQKLTGAVLPASGRSLSTALAAAGISNAHAHAALGDAEATAELLQHYLGTHRSTVERFLGGVRTVELPVAELSSGAVVALCPRTGAASGVQDGVWLNQLSSGIPLAGDANVDEYLDLLSTAMLDRVLSAHEVQQLTDCAADLGISREIAVDLHTGFIRQLAVLAWADGTVTEEERDDLLAAARALGVSEEEVSRFLESPDAAGTVDAVDAGRGAQARLGLRLAPGDRVTFTGATEIPREVWEARATEAGLDVGGVKKASALVVAADPDSFSRKAAKARDLGIPVVSESGFARLLGELENSGSGEINPRTVLEASHHEHHEDDEPDAPETFDDDDAEVGLSGQFYDEDDQAFSEILGEAVDVATGLLSYLARTHGSLRAAVEHAGISAVDGELPSYVEDLLARAGDEDGALNIATTMRRGTVQDVLARAWGACDEREQLILRNRFVALDGATLDELGAEIGVTRERVRQLEKKLMTRLRPMVTSGPVADLLAGIRVHAHPVNTLEAVTDIFPELAVTQRGWEAPLWQILDAFDDDFRVDDGWVCFPDLPTAAQRTGNLVTPMANEEGVARVADILERSSLDDEKVLREWLRTCGFHIAGEHVFTRAGSIPARAAAVLSVVGEPMAAMEIYSAANETKSERSFRNRLGASDAISRVSIDRWALTRWGLEEYTGIADLIGRRLDAAESMESPESPESPEASVPIDDLLEELPRKFGVSAQSVRTYASTGEFELSDGIVRRRTEPMVNTAEPEDSNGLYVRAGRWCFLVTVSNDHLRGVGINIPNGMTSGLGLTWNEPREFPSDRGRHRVLWGNTGTSYVSSVREILEEQNRSAGDRVWIDLHDGEYFSVAPALPATLGIGAGMAWLAQHVGAEASTDEAENTSAVAVALGLKANAPRRKILARFRHRSDHEAVELLERLWM